MDITPRMAAGRQIINAYGGGGFRVGGVAYVGSVLVLPDRTLAWPVTAMAELALETLTPLGDALPKVEVLLIGCGAHMAFVPRALRDALKAGGIACDGMDTGAACRTYNVLLAEDRRVAAALIAVQ